MRIPPRHASVGADLCVCRHCRPQYVETATALPISSWCAFGTRADTQVPYIRVAERNLRLKRSAPKGYPTRAKPIKSSGTPNGRDTSRGYGVETRLDVRPPPTQGEGGVGAASRHRALQPGRTAVR